jgi:hypothetical protein
MWSEPALFVLVRNRGGLKKVLGLGYIAGSGTNRPKKLPVDL